MLHPKPSKDIRKLLVIMKADKSILLKSSENKIWIFNEDCLKYSKHLYHPNRISGKIIKKCLKVIVLFGFPFIKEVNISDYMNIYIDKYIKREYPDGIASLYLGTPCVHQKATVQLINPAGTVYIKYSKSRRVGELFENERNMLNYLKKYGVENVPDCIDFGNDSIFYIVQTGLAEYHEKAIWTNAHEKFINELFKKTKQVVPFEKTDFYQSIWELENKLNNNYFWFGKILQKSIELVVDEYKGKDVEFGVCHRDFTPWNMSAKKAVYVYDWEYAKITYPKGIDYFHFFTRTFFLKNQSIECLWKKYKKSRKYNGENNFIFMEYLLDFSSLYIQRGADSDILNVEKIIPLIRILYREIMLDRKNEKK